jgi:hypothetical protein
MAAKKSTKKAAKARAKKTPVRTPKKEVNKPPVPQPDFGWHDAFILAFEQNANISAACEAAGVPRRSYYDHYENYGEFRKRADEAKDRAVESLEEIAWERARAQSDTLTIFLLKAHKPGLYNPTLKIDVSTLTDEELDQLARG